MLKRVRAVWPYLLVVWLYVATSPYHRGLNNPNEMVRVYMSVAAVDDGGFVIDPVIRRWGMVDDKAKRNGHLYSSKAPLQSLVGIPAYAVAKPILGGFGLPADARHVTFVLRLLGSAVFGLALAFALIAWCRRRADALGAPRGQGTALGLALALGTMHYPYSLTFTGHILAAATAGGGYLAVATLSRLTPESRSWWGWVLVTGFLAGAAPFAEYPAALVALPTLIGAWLLTPSRRAKGRLLLGLAAGGALPFLLGLWAHHELWGSPFATGYGFLENPGYIQVHGSGFFGVRGPKLDALIGTLLSPGTGLFFFSPFLALGLLPLGAALIRRPSSLPSGGYGRPFAVIAAAGLILELLFISGHQGWRGGWTLGPRYIIPVVVLLGFWCVEGLAYARLRAPLMAVAAASILITGPAAALYPHLSDVYTNPWLTFVVPSYVRGEMSYGIGHGLGLNGGAANLIHLVPLAGAVLFTAWAGSGPRGAGGPRQDTLLRRSGWVAATLVLVGAAVSAMPEDSPKKARRENRRLWGFWEPKNPLIPLDSTYRRPPGRRLGTARQTWPRIVVQRRGADGQVRPCLPPKTACTYGDEPWQRFGPEYLTMNGRNRAILFMHPIAGETVAATVPVPNGATKAVLRYGLADPSVEANNPHPVRLQLTQGGDVLGSARAGDDYGYQALELALTSTEALQLRADVVQDGARVLGWDIEFYLAAPPAPSRP